MVRSTVHGLPRIGPHRELKVALESYWAGKGSAEELVATARSLREANRALLREAGIDLIPSNDFSLYDHVLDAIALSGAVPPRYGAPAGPIDLDLYFAMARGGEATAMEMTKWFDTNYHHIVPELGPETGFALSDSKPLDYLREAETLGLTTKPVLLGPVSFLLFAKTGEGVTDPFEPLELLNPLLDVYAELLARLGELGAEWVQLDEPCFAQDRDGRELAALACACERLAAVESRPKLCVSTYFDHAGEALPVLAGSALEGIGLDFVAGPRNLDLLYQAGGLEKKALFAGVVDGRNIWINDLDASLRLLDELGGLCGEMVVSTSCSLLHVPFDLDAETALDPELRSWMAFARQKVGEVVTLARGLEHGTAAIAAELEANRRALQARRGSPRTRGEAVRARVAALGAADAGRASSYEARAPEQRRRLGLPPLPTTTIGSFPQTAELREARVALGRGEIDAAEYERRMREEIEQVVHLQEDLGLDVLVHGEPERNDMVRYFAERLEGFAFAEHGWVQSYGSRCVRPPILFGDVRRPAPMTVGWALYAQSLTERPVKGMLTGPVTMLQWSFARDDQPRAQTATQLALVVRDEFADLQDAGIAAIQVDEPAIREGLPLRRADCDSYLRWAVDAFRIATGAAREETQVQTHMCYSDFGDIMDSIQAMDADVLLIEAARSRMQLLEDWRRSGYRQEIGPGVYDIHSPRVPSVEEMADLLRRALDVLPAERLWVVPDCGLKTRRYEEAVPALGNMVEAARLVREELAGKNHPPGHQTRQWSR